MRLSRIVVENLLIIEAAELRFGEGLSVISGETGTGKTVLTRVFDLLSGAPGEAGLVRAGADDAYVEATWELDEAERLDWQAVVGDLVEIGEQVTTARRMVGRRSFGLVNGRTCPLATIRQLAADSLMLYGQYEQEQLSRPDQQRALVDRGLGTDEAFERYREARRVARAAAASVADREAAAAIAERERDLLTYEHGELVEAAPEEGETGALLERLATLTRSRELSADLEGAIAGIGALREAAEEVEGLLGRLELPERLDGAITAIAETEYALLRRAEGTDVDETEEDRLQTRLGLLHDLARKHRCQPDELTSVLEARARRLDEIASAVSELELARAEAERALSVLSERGTLLSEGRAAALDAWLERVHEQLPAVALDGMRLRIDLDRYPGSTPLETAGPHGFEQVRMAVRASPGLPWGSVETSASGGERSRLTLALVGLSGGGEKHVVVMDEPDTGIGGTTAHGIGDRLRDLASDQQTIVVSHLPQIALRADRQYVVTKTLSSESTETRIEEVKGDRRLDELCRMSGYDPTDRQARATVSDLLAKHGGGAVSRRELAASE